MKGLRSKLSPKEDQHPYKHFLEDDTDLGPPSPIQEDTMKGSLAIQGQHPQY